MCLGVSWWYSCLSVMSHVGPHKVAEKGFVSVGKNLSNANRLSALMLEMCVFFPKGVHAVVEIYVMGSHSFQFLTLTKRLKFVKELAPKIVCETSPTKSNQINSEGRLSSGCSVCLLYSGIFIPLEL